MKSTKHRVLGSRKAANFRLRKKGLAVAFISGMCAFGFGPVTSFAAQSGNSATNRDYSNFEIIGKRNIFNPNRSRGYVPRDRTPSVYRRIESFALVGVMSYGRGPMAFFDGTRSDYKKVLKPNDTIGGFKVTAIDDSSVKLASSTNEIEVQVGMQMASEEGGPWKLSQRPENLAAAVHDAPMRSSSAVNSERESAASNQNGNNPFAGFGGFPGGFNPGGFNPGGFANQPAPAAQPTAAPSTAQPAGDPNDILARLAARRAQETGGDSPPNQGEPSSNPPGPAQPGPTGQLPPIQSDNPGPTDQSGNGQLPPNPVVQPRRAQLPPTQSPGTLPENQQRGALPGQNLEQSPNQNGESPQNPNP